jgi:hypothetical protein
VADSSGDSNDSNDSTHSRTRDTVYLGGCVVTRGVRIPCKRQVAGSTPAGGSTPDQRKDPGAKIARGLLDGNADGNRCLRGHPAAERSAPLDEVSVFVEEHPVVHSALRVGVYLALSQSKGSLR